MPLTFLVEAAAASTMHTVWASLGWKLPVIANIKIQRVIYNWILNNIYIQEIPNRTIEQTPPLTPKKNQKATPNCTMTGFA